MVAKKKCLDCGKSISKKATRCNPCAAKVRRHSGAYDNAFGEEFGKKMSGVIGANWASGKYDTEGFQRGRSERMKTFNANRTYTSKPPNCCMDCGKEIRRRSVRCRSCASKNQWADDQYREITVRGIRRAAQRPEVRAERIAQLRAARDRGVYATPEYRRKRSKLAKAQFGTPEGRRQNAEKAKAARARGCYENMYTPEVLKKMSRGQKAAWIRGCYDGVFKGPSSIEIKVSKALEELGIPNSPQHRLYGDSRPFDFFAPPNTLIEVDGEYWHSKPGAKERDQSKSELAAGRGFRLVRIQEEELKTRGAQIIVKERVLPSCYKP